MKVNKRSLYFDLNSTFLYISFKRLCFASNYTRYNLNTHIIHIKYLYILKTCNITQHLYKFRDLYLYVQIHRHESMMLKPSFPSINQMLLIALNTNQSCNQLGTTSHSLINATHFTPFSLPLFREPTPNHHPLSFLFSHPNPKTNILGQ